MAGPVVDPEVEAYAEAHTTPPPPALLDVAARTRQAEAAHGMMVGALEGRFLEFLAHMTAARSILEIGTFTGYSALSFAAGLREGGRVITCEVDASRAAMAQAHIDATPYASTIEIRLGPALDTIASLDGPFDLVFIDADKTNYANYYDAVLPKLAGDGAIAVDNTLWSRKVLDAAENDADTAALRAFNDMVRADERVVCVQLTIRDGVTLIRKAT